jgi:hypothetical protein
MTTPPLPASPCLRVRLILNGENPLDLGNRLFFSYGGTAPTGANCTALAGDIAAAWASDLAPLTPDNYSLGEVDVLDIASDSGLSGQWTGSDPGTRAGSYLPVNCAVNVEFDIARRYRGGKPRMYLSPGVQADLVSQGDWGNGFVTQVNTGVAAFFAAIEATVIGAVGPLKHVNLSYYKGFTNVTNSSGRERAVPTYRASALVDPIVGYSAKQVVGSQRRRRTSTTP